MNLPTELPHLEGTRGRVVGWLFIALTTLAALLAVGGTIFTAIDDFRNIPVDGGYGFETLTSGRGGSTIWQTSLPPERQVSRMGITSSPSTDIRFR